MKRLEPLLLSPLFAGQLFLALPSACAEGESRRERVLAIAEAEARRADEGARARWRDREADPLERALLQHLERVLGLELLVPALTEDPALEAQRALEALRTEVYARLSRLRSTGYAALAGALEARRAFEHRVIRMELSASLPDAGVEALAAAFSEEPSLRGVLFVHARVSAEIFDGLSARLEGLQLEARRLIVDRSELPRDGATLFLVRQSPHTRGRD